jgi:hypothetical protein
LHKQQKIVPKIRYVATSDDNNKVQKKTKVDKNDMADHDLTNAEDSKDNKKELPKQNLPKTTLDLSRSNPWIPIGTSKASN